MKAGILAGFALLGTLTEGLHVPGIMSKDYSYKDTLTIQ